jgi:hypothetical protein
MVIPCNFVAKGRWASPNCKEQGSFTPSRENPSLIGVLPNPVDWESEETWSARVFVGFNVGLTPTYGIEDLIAIVKEVRKKQTGLPDSTFLAQKGIYTYQEGQYKGQYSEERGGQAIVLNVEPVQVPKEQFITDMQSMAEVIAAALQQEKVVLEIQRNGVVQKTYGISPVK